MAGPAANDGRGGAAALCVVHLVRELNGPEPLREFLDSYRRHQAGAEHRLVLLFKGFADHRAAAPYRELAGDLSFEEVMVSDAGFDLSAYRRAAESLSAGTYCFLNSHSRIVADGWLGHLDRALSVDGVGLAGCTGSWASVLSFACFNLGLPSAYRSVFGERRDTLRRFNELQAERPDAVSARRQLINTAIAFGPLVVGFRRFPAHHLRTNAFVASHEVLMRALRPDGGSKKAALAIESGRRSLTRTVERMGLGAVVVDRTGRAHRPADWPASDTFWQGRQDGLLVADNQTEQYRLAEPARRRLLSSFAWGRDARPA